MDLILDYSNLLRYENFRCYHPQTITPPSKVYNFEPIPENLKEKYHNSVLDLEAPLWTEGV